MQADSILDHVSVVFVDKLAKVEKQEKGFAGPQ